MSNVEVIEPTKKRVVAKRKQQEPYRAPEVNMTEAQAMAAVIERAARDPNVDIGKMKELFTMRNELRMQAKQDAAEERERDFHAAWAAAQAGMKRIAADSANDQTRSRYASLAALDGAIRPIYTENGFAVSYDTEPLPEGAIRIIGYLTRDGHTVRRQTDQPCDGKGAKGGDVMTRTHAHKSAITYGRRELLEMLFNLATSKDDDGNAASRPLGEVKAVSDLQVREISDLLTDTKSDMVKFLARMKVESLAELRADKFEEIKSYIRSIYEKREKAKADVEKANAEANAARDKEGSRDV
jgi:hypothetical protein